MPIFLGFRHCLTGKNRFFDPKRQGYFSCIVQFILAFTSIFSPLPVCAGESLPSSLSSHFVSNFDELILPQNERLGLLGTSYLIELNPYLSSGIGVYSAISGVRGGFFTGGITFDGGMPFGRHWLLNGGLFMGGGGGGAAPQGGGLMIRPYAGLLYRIDQNAMGLGYSRVWFPNGAINSGQLTLVYTRQFYDDLRPGWDVPHRHLFTNRPEAEGTRQRAWAMLHQWYFSPNAQNRRRGNGNGSIPLLGARWRVHVDGAWFYDLQALGAWGGDADGYAEWDVGLGKSKGLGAFGSLYSVISIGSAGGGGIDTAGGLLARVGAGWTLPVVRSLPIKGFVDMGYLASVEGRYNALTTTAGIEYQYGVPRRSADAAHWQALRIRPSAQRYHLRYDSLSNSPNVQSQIDLVQLKLDWLIYRQIYAGVQTSAAYAGGVGGYATGMVGAGICVFCSTGWSINGEWYVGAAGGGGMPIGNGAVTQGQLSLHRRGSDWLEWTVGAGRFIALGSPLRAWMVELGAGIRFSSPRS